MAKSRARLVIWCLVLASVGFELAKWRRSGNGTRATSVGPHLGGGAHHFGSLIAHHRHRDHAAGKHTDAGGGVDGRIRTHASAQALLERARPAHAVDPETDGEPSDRERPREPDEAKTRKNQAGNVSASSCLGVAGVEYAGDVVEGGWGADATRGLAASASACCARCRAHATCNVWVFCDPDETRCRADALAGQCWLKRQTLARGVAPAAMASGGGTPWTSGADRRFDEEAVEVVPRIELSEWFKPLDAARRTPRYGDDGDRASVGETKPNYKNQPPRRRECGDPAADAYAGVDATCLERSRTAVETLALLFQDKRGDKEEKEKEGHDLSHRFARVAAWHEPNASFDGLAVRWGIGHFQPSAAACAAACVRHEPVGTKRGGPFGALPCNAFVWCPADVPGGACFEPDAHAHGAGDCWLKFTETPEAPQVNQRGANDAAAFTNEAGVSYRERHRDAPERTHWTSGVVLPRGWVPSGGTYGPRARW